MSQHILGYSGEAPSGDLLRTGFSVTSETIDGGALLRLHGELDTSTATVLRQALGEELEKGPASVIVDLSQLCFIDSSGIGVLVGASRRARESGCSFVLQEPARSVRKALQLTGVDQMMHVEQPPPLS